jgi:NAD+ synthase (glutamine-hydrolysing)
MWMNVTLSLKIGVEICEDAWVPDSPSINHALMGATVLANLSASNEVVGKKEFRSNSGQHDLG